MEQRWGIVDVDISADLEDAVLAEAGDGLLGAQVLGGVEGLRLSLCFESLEAAEGVALRLRGWLGEVDRSERRGVSAVRELQDQGWLEMYEASLVPFRLGRRFVVHRREASFSRARDPAVRRWPLLIVPGRAFGTGEHATTRLCAEALESLVAPGSEWVDLGTGTGILALVATRLGASRVLALDRDPEAVALAHVVLGANGVGGAVRVECGSLDGSWGGPWDGIVANIALPYFLHGVGTLAARLRAGGVIVASGFLRCDVRELRHAFIAAGLRPIRTRSRRDWAVLVAVAEA